MIIVYTPTIFIICADLIRLKRRQMLNRSTEGNKDYAKTSQEEEELRSFEKVFSKDKF